jgi:hypothetical protein
MSNKIGVLDERILLDAIDDINEIHYNVSNAMGKISFFDKDAPKVVKEKLFYANNWIKNALEIKGIKIPIGRDYVFNLFQSSSEIILKLRAIMISLKTVKRTPSISNAIKYIIEAIFILKVK